MSEGSVGQGSADEMNFDAVYRGESPVAGQDFTFDVVPWDIGEAQPEVVALVNAGRFHGEVLDSGCGPGDNTVLLAERGYGVTGVDGSPTAIEQARQRAAGCAGRVEFAVGDVTRLDGFEQRFDTVLDSGLYHCLDEDQRRQYSAALHAVTRPGATLHLFCFSDDRPEQFTPGAVSKDDLHTNLGAHWNITRIEPVSFTSAFDRDMLRRMAESSVAEQYGVTFDPDAMFTDDRGRMLMPMWRLEAERR